MSTPFKRLLIANRGEIAIRIAQACDELGIESVAVFAEDDRASLHSRKADIALALPGRGVAAYLNMQALIDLATAHDCQAIHPGYGFLAENPAFAERCQEAGLTFIGPSSDVLKLFGDKACARALAERCAVPLVPGINQAIDLAQAQAFLQEHGPIMLKALAGGGGRGMSPVDSPEQLAEAFARCQAQAQGAFGCADLYVEKRVLRARHIEIQVLGDGTGNVSHLWERDCSLQRQQQKLIEMAPSPDLDDNTRQAMITAALCLAAEVKYQGLATFEFLLDLDAPGHFYFMEANPRVQVEHTVTEQITGVDLVQSQIRLAAGATLSELKLSQPPKPAGFAIELRINAEGQQADGSVRPAAGVLSLYQPPSGPGLRVDGYGYSGYAVSPVYDSLLAKLIVSGETYPAALRRAYRALSEFALEGVANNKALLQNLLRREEVQNNQLDTCFVERHLPELLSPASHPTRHAAHVQSASAEQSLTTPEGCTAVAASSAGVLVSVQVGAGEPVVAGQVLAIIEAMKMELELRAPSAGIVRSVVAQNGAILREGQTLLFIEADAQQQHQECSEQALDLEHIRADLNEVLERHQRLLDTHRPEAVAKRRKTGQRTARENLDDLLDSGSFIEYGAMALAAQRGRRKAEELIELSPADGLIAGIGTVNASQVGEQAARCMALSYDYTVFAGTQGVMNHKKTDRMLALAAQWRLPVVLFAEGGGGRPGDTDFVGVAGLDCHTFVAMAKLSGLVPTVGVVSGRCFAGNAALLGCCDVIIATQNASIGMAGPAMIEGGGLGSFKAEEVGPTHVQGPNGVIDVLVADEAEAVAAAKQYLSYFQGAQAHWQYDDARTLRHLIPENRLRVYDMRRVIEHLADIGSVLELRRQFAPGMITALVRIEGKPFGLMANNPAHLGGAIDAAAGDKAARFMQLCQAHGLPMISLCDTPGFMVGPEAEQQATVRHVSRLFVTAASLSVPFFTLVLRKGYGLGAQAMAAGSFHSPLFTAAWPSGEFGAMGIEGAVRLGFAKELAAQTDETARKALFDTLVSKMVANGKALNMASYLEIDAVIDPAESRHWLLRGLNASGHQGKDAAQARPFIDTW